MTVFDVFLSMRWEYKAISIVIWGVVGFAIHLILKTLKKPKSETTFTEEPIETILKINETTLTEIEEPSKLLDKPMPFHPDDLPIKQVDTTSTSKKQFHERVRRFIREPAPMKKFDEPEIKTLRPYQREGIHGYTRKPRKGPEHELDIKRKAEGLTKEEAWSELGESFWDTRREGLKQFHPEIYNEIRYWETHLDDYNTRIGMMWVFGIPLGEYDLWVRRRK